MPLRKVIFWIHLSAGLTAGLVIANMAVTGMIMAFEPQIVAWAERGQRAVAVPQNAARLSADEIAARAQAARPGGTVAGITLKSDPSASALVSFGRESGALYIHPYTGGVLGAESKAHRFMHWIEDWHRWFGKKEVGKPVTGAAALLFFFMALSGLYIWWPKVWTLQFVKSSALFGSGLSGKARDWNWHNVFGIWCLPLLLVTTTTGLVMSYDWANNLLYKAARSEMPVFQKMPAPDNPADQKLSETSEPRASWDALFAAAQAHEPVWTSINIRAPQKPGGTFNATIQLPHHRHPSALTLLTLDGRSAAVIRATPFSGQSRGVRWRTWVKPIHTGEAGGWFGQLLMFLSASGAAMLVWTGAALSIRRFAAYRARK